MYIERNRIQKRGAKDHDVAILNELNLYLFFCPTDSRVVPVSSTVLNTRVPRVKRLNHSGFREVTI